MTKKETCDACGTTNINISSNFDPLGDPGLYELKNGEYSGLVCDKCYNEIIDEIGSQINEWTSEFGIETSIEMDVNLIDRLINKFHEIKKMRKKL